MELQNPRGELGKVSGIYRHGRAEGDQARRGRRRARPSALGKLEHGAHRRYARRARAPRSSRLATPAAPQPVLRQVVNPTERKDEVKLSSALTRMVEEDPSLSVTHRQDTGETVLGGQGEMHLRVAVERLTGRFAAEARDASARSSPIARRSAPP